jgi:hypothetical protein
MDYRGNHALKTRFYPEKRRERWVFGPKNLVGTWFAF